MVRNSNCTVLAIGFVSCLVAFAGTTLGQVEPIEEPDPCPIYSSPCGACTSTCASPSDSSQCSQCCTGNATCITCCGGFVGQAKQKCKAYCDAEFPNSASAD